MKSLKEYIIESKKTYQFKVGVAGEIPEHFEERFRSALEKFSLVNLSAGKKTPIQTRPLDFPQLENEQVTYWDVEVNYPTTEAVLHNYIGQACSVHESHIVVHNPAIARVREEENKEENKTYETIIGNDNMEGTSAQESVGNSRVMELLKELEAARKEKGDNEFKIEPVKEDPTNTKSAVGS